VHVVHLLRGQDLNLRPLGYEPSELPSCSTPRRNFYLSTRAATHGPHGKAGHEEHHATECPFPQERGAGATGLGERRRGCDLTRGNRRICGRGGRERWRGRRGGRGVGCWILKQWSELSGVGIGGDGFGDS
jgi:hypothetical protein